MNIILFRFSEVELPLPRSDPRAQHILTVLRRSPGEFFDAGLINGPRGKGVVVSANPKFLQLAFTWNETPPPVLHPLVLLIGLPRPQTARDILRDATTLGVSAMHFFRTQKGEVSYGDSTLWRSGDWEKCVIKGASQAFCTRLPEITHGGAPAEIIAALPAAGVRVALDNYEATSALSKVAVAAGPSVTLALGAERGWSDGERALLRQQGFIFAHLGERVLRTETACVAAIAVIKAKCGWL